MIRMLLIALAVVVTNEIPVAADNYRVEVLEEAVPADDLSEEVAAMLSERGLRVVRGSNRTVCEIWPCKSWAVKSDFKPTSELLYPFEPGQLIGVLRLRRRGSDFRSQQLSSGVYTLRFGMQPVDGNHVGTSPTRDFLLLVRAEDDKSPESMSVEQLLKLSATAAESSHPAMMCLQRVTEPGKETAPAMRHDEERDWWLLRFTNDASSGDTKSSLPVELVVEGHAEE